MPELLTLHVLCHDPVVEQPVVFHRALHHFHQQVVSSSPGGVGFALWLLSVLQTGQQEQEVEDVSQELLENSEIGTFTSLNVFLKDKSYFNNFLGTPVDFPDLYHAELSDLNTSCESQMSTIYTA